MDRESDRESKQNWRFSESFCFNCVKKLFSRLAIFALSFDDFDRYDSRVMKYSRFVSVIFTLLAIARSDSAFAVRFPPDFRWCVATSAHQIEGGNFNSDWWLFENQKGRIRRGDTSAVADDHWNRVPEDIELLKKLNVSDYRMSVEWAKIEPRQGMFNEAAITHYRDEIRALQAVGIRPIITLHHFTFPQWVRSRGGFEWVGLPRAFARFAGLVYQRIAPETETWVTINEPMVNLLAGYVAGVEPPAEKRDIGEVPPVMIGVLKAHAAAYHGLHRLAASAGRKIRIGMAHHLRTFDAFEPWLPTDQVMADLADQAFNWSLPEAMETGRFRFHLLWKVDVDVLIEGLKGTQDYIGVNYYSGDLVHISVTEGFKTEKRRDLPVNDLGWPIYPQGFARILNSVGERFPGKSILITENGIADVRDRMRSAFIRDHLLVVADAIGRGLPVEGYCHWSIYDNFEWIEGYKPRFGLYEVNYRTLERIPRPSAREFSEIARRNGF